MPLCMQPPCLDGADAFSCRVQLTRQVLWYCMGSTQTNGGTKSMSWCFDVTLFWIYGSESYAPYDMVVQKNWHFWTVRGQLGGKPSVTINIALFRSAQHFRALHSFLLFSLRLCTFVQGKYGGISSQIPYSISAVEWPACLTFFDVWFFFQLLLIPNSIYFFLRG